MGFSQTLLPAGLGIRMDGRLCTAVSTLPEGRQCISPAALLPWLLGERCYPSPLLVIIRRYSYRIPCFANFLDPFVCIVGDCREFVRRYKCSLLLSPRGVPAADLPPIPALKTNTSAPIFSIYLGKRRGYGTERLAYKPHNTSYVVLGTVFLWCVLHIIRLCSHVHMFVIAYFPLGSDGSVCRLVVLMWMQQLTVVLPLPLYLDHLFACLRLVGG